jgi:hypothetical protein
MDKIANRVGLTREAGEHNMALLGRINALYRSKSYSHMLPLIFLLSNLGLNKSTKWLFNRAP